ncbi:unnamed protein product [Boreogadus saida]
MEMVALAVAVVGMVVVAVVMLVVLVVMVVLLVLVVMLVVVVVLLVLVVMQVVVVVEVVMLVMLVEVVLVGPGLLPPFSNRITVNNPPWFSCAVPWCHTAIISSSHQRGAGTKKAQRGERGGLRACRARE